MTEEFLESEILFSDDDFDSDQTLVDAKYHRKSQNEIRFYYGHHVNYEFSENGENSSHRSYKISKRDQEDYVEEEGRKYKRTSPIEIPWKDSNGSRYKAHQRETELEDRECFFMPPHEILARRFANKHIYSTPF